MMGGNPTPPPGFYNDVIEAMRRNGVSPMGGPMQAPAAAAPQHAPSMPSGMFGAAPQSVAPNPMIAPTNAPPPSNPSFFGEGGTGRGIAGSVGDFLLQSAGARPIYAPAMQQQRQAQREDGRLELMMRREDRQANKPQILTRPDGSIVAVNPYDQSISDIAPGVQKPDEPTNLERQMRYYQSLPAGPEKDIARAAIIGATNDPNFYEPKANAQQRRDVELRQTPTFSDLNPKPSERQGGAKNNPIPVSTREQLQAVPRGTWVTLPNGSVVQRR